MITVKELKDFCNEQIKMGNADKPIYITSDDEGNSYHGLFYQFTGDPDEIREIAKYCLFDEDIDPEKVVLLG